MYRAVLFLFAAGILRPQNTPEDRFTLARSALGKGNHAEAIRAFEDILRQSPGFDRAWRDLLATYQRAGRLDEARTWVDSFPEPYRCFAQVPWARTAGQWPEAEAAARACSARLPDYLPLYQRWLLAAQRRPGGVAALRTEFHNDTTLGRRFGFAAATMILCSSLPEAECAAAEATLLAIRAETDQWDAGDTLYFLYRALRRRDRSRDASQWLLDRARRTRDGDWLYRALGRLAEDESGLGNYSAAARLLEEAMPYNEIFGSAEAEAVQRHSYGLALFHLGRYPESNQQFALALAKTREGASPAAELSRIYGNWALVAEAQGGYAQALERYQNALAAAKAAGYQQGIAIQSLNVIQRLLALGRNTAAADLLNQALPVAASLHPRIQGQLQAEIGSAFKELGKPAESIAAYRKSLELSAQQGHTWNLARTRLALAQAAAEQRQFESARRDLAEAHALASKMGEQRLLGLTSIARGHLLWAENKDNAGARGAFEAALGAAKALPSLGLEWQAESGLAGTAWREGKFEVSLAHRARAIAALEKMREWTVSAEQRSGFLAARVGAYGEAARASLRLGKTDDAFEWLDRGRARAWLDLIEDSRNPATESDQVKAAMRELAVSAGDKRKQEAAALDLERAMAAARPEPLAAAEPSPIEAVRGALPRGAALLSYWMDQAEPSVFVLDERGSRAVRLAAAEAIERDVRRFLELISHPPARAARAEMETLSRTLHRQLLASAVPRGVTELIIVPSGPLHHLPFEALTNSDGRLLVQTHSVRYMPSASALVRLRGSRPPARIAWSGFGASPKPDWPAAPSRGAVLNALPFALREVERIGAMYPSGRRAVFAGDRATKSELIEGSDARESEILHIAAHGVVDPARPGFSGLLLAPSGGTPGLAFAYEISQMRVRADLVVLSACRSADGPELAGEGLLSLTRPFFSAGARSVLASLWLADDRAAEAAMTAFYRAIRGGAATARALRQAKLAMLADPASAHPYYWAGFALYGASGN